MQNPYLSSSRINTLLRSLSLRPTRAMGQNFLIDSEALAAIVDAADLEPDDVVLEVGPGLGVLTWELLQRARQVVAVELDKRLAARLREAFVVDQHLAIVQSDILNIAPSDALAAAGLPDVPYKVVANLPYAITSPVLRHLLEASHKPQVLVVLVQWEVAQRICAVPGDLSVLAHSVQIYAEPEIIARVPAQSFLPAPAVDSAVLRLRVRPALAADVDSVDRLLRVIKAGFLQARKKLGNSLSSGLATQGVPLDKQAVVELLRAAGVDPDRRAETVTLQEWVAVYHALAARQQAHLAADHT